MLKYLFILALSSYCWLPAVGQITSSDQRSIHAIHPPRSVIGIKSNLLYDATTTLNVGVEIATGSRTSLDLSGNYNPWTFSGSRRLKHLLIQPEYRWWSYKPFTRHFWGIHAHYGNYNTDGMLPWGFKDGKMFGLENRQLSSYRYDGWLVGGGISYGYHWIVGKRWGVETTIGVGYAFLSYDKFDCAQCGDKFGDQLSKERKHYIGPTKAGITLIYMIK